MGSEIQSISGFGDVMNTGNVLKWEVTAYDSEYCPHLWKAWMLQFS